MSIPLCKLVHVESTFGACCFEYDTKPKDIVPVSSCVHVSPNAQIVEIMHYFVCPTFPESKELA